jgi:pilus assembly protein CpaF
MPPERNTGSGGVMVSDDLDGLIESLHARVAVDDPRVATTREDVARLARREHPLAGAEVVDDLVDRILARTTGLDALEPLLGDPEITEIMVNGSGPVWVERQGALDRTELRLTARGVYQLIDRIVTPLGLRVDRTSPVIDARLPDGSRVNVVIPPLAVDGPCVTIRRFRARPIELRELCTPAIAELLDWAVQRRSNIIVSGGTGAGKTTLLNALAAGIAPGERVVTVEDAAELRLPGEHVVRLEARPANADGLGAVTVRSLVRNALRMRPDRIIVGEVRGGEALDMVQAMNTGHEGSLSTCHANSPADALRRLETMVLMSDVVMPLEAVREQLSAAIDLVVHIVRAGDGSRQVAQVAEVTTASATERVRLLAIGGALQSLPRRTMRAAGSPADVRWLR